MQLDIQSVNMQRIIIFGTCIVLGLGIIAGATLESHGSAIYNDSKTLKLEEPKNSNPRFDESFYDTLRLKMRNYAKKLTVDQINDLTEYGEDLDASMADKVENVLGVYDDSVSIFDSSELDILMRGQILNGQMDFEQV